MVKKKRQSKRVKLKDKYKIEKKVRQHKAKERRAARKSNRDGTALRKAKRKDPGLPNLLPYKEKFLAQLKEQKEREIKQQNLRQARRRDELLRRRSGPSADDLAKSAQRAEKFEDNNSDVKDEFVLNSSDGMSAKKKRLYMKEMCNVIDLSDVVLFVLDARDPNSCRASLVENMVLQHARKKRLVFILNKIDLVPKEVVEDWLTVLRREFPTVAFRASTQQQKSKLGRAGKDSIALGSGNADTNTIDTESTSKTTIGDSVCVGADTLLQLLKNYSRNRDIKTAITVGVVGYPNVGKSSVINSLKRCRAVGVSPTAGFTKTLQIVHVDKKVKLIDSPGVLFQDSTHDAENSTKLVLKNCVNPATVDDPIKPVSELYDRVDKEKLMLLYKLKKFSTALEFIALLAKKRGKLKQGGIPDMEAAARIVLQDLNVGKIRYFTKAPTSAQSKKTNKKTAEIVSAWSKEFDMDALIKMEQSELVQHDDGDNNDDDDDMVVVG
mmetsp:Transcript_35944/g.44631  ORF Transcript_35944/g.44631 Transcript_35944/m.44631 type:complete len:495 (+) Transcript_35944:168-1652(+)